MFDIFKKKLPKTEMVEELIKRLPGVYVPGVGNGMTATFLEAAMKEGIMTISGWEVVDGEIRKVEKK